MSISRNKNFKHTVRKEQVAFILSLHRISHSLGKETFVHALPQQPSQDKMSKE